MTTYLDSVDGAIEVKEIPVTTNGKKGVTKLIECETQNKSKEIIENPNLELFNKIYDNFNEKNPLENTEIKNKLKGKNGEIYSNFIDFCNFLIKKIEDSDNKSKINKIPQIISNLSNYKGKTGGTRITDNIVKDKRAEVMRKYAEKIGDKKGHIRKANQNYSLYK